MTQLSFFPTEPKPTGQTLRDKGIRKAIQHCEDIHPSWHDKALAWLETYARTHREFSGEEVRMASAGIIPEPPHARSWGSVMLTGARRGWIRKIGYVTVKNPQAHACFASKWRSCLRPTGDRDRENQQGGVRLERGGLYE